jgi:hypothetical protein
MLWASPFGAVRVRIARLVQLPFCAPSPDSKRSKMAVNNFYEQSDKNQQEGPGERVAFRHIADQKSGIARFLGHSVGVL